MERDGWPFYLLKSYKLNKILHKLAGYIAEMQKYLPDHDLPDSRTIDNYRQYVAWQIWSLYKTNIDVMN